MSKFQVKKSSALKGSVRIEGAKNAVLPIIAATLLSDGVNIIENVPMLKDVVNICDLLRTFGSKIDISGNTLKIDNSGVDRYEAHYELVRKMRASFLVMGPLLARFNKAKISMPGGCAIGTRPVDLHLKGFRALDSNIEIDHGFIEASTDGLKGNKIYLDFPSVGATENIMMAAAGASGTTIIENAAEEPEIVDLAKFINEMGGKVRGAGTNTIKIEGVSKFAGTTHVVIPDRIEAGTYMVAAAITKGDIKLENVIIDHLKPMIAKLKETGCEIIEGDDWIRVIGSKTIKSTNIKTMPHPGFPTDMQSQFMALLSIADGTSVITETIFENRFMHTNELSKMGANIKVEGRTAVVQGEKTLEGAIVSATDLRAGAALILTGLVSEGETVVENIFHVDRGYVKIEEKLKKLGANIERIE